MGSWYNIFSNLIKEPFGNDTNYRVGEKVAAYSYINIICSESNKTKDSITVDDLHDEIVRGTENGEYYTDSLNNMGLFFIKEELFTRYNLVETLYNEDDSSKRSILEDVYEKFKDDFSDLCYIIYSAYLTDCFEIVLELLLDEYEKSKNSNILDIFFAINMECNIELSQHFNENIVKKLKENEQCKIFLKTDEFRKTNLYKDLQKKRIVEEISKCDTEKNNIVDKYIHEIELSTFIEIITEIVEKENDQSLLDDYIKIFEYIRDEKSKGAEDITTSCNQGIFIAYYNKNLYSEEPGKFIDKMINSVNHDNLEKEPQICDALMNIAIISENREIKQKCLDEYLKLITPKSDVDVKVNCDYTFESIIETFKPIKKSLKSEDTVDKKNKEYALSLLANAFRKIKTPKSSDCQEQEISNNLDIIAELFKDDMAQKFLKPCVEFLKEGFKDENFRKIIYYSNNEDVKLKFLEEIDNQHLNIQEIISQDPCDSFSLSQLLFENKDNKELRLKIIDKIDQISNSPEMSDNDKKNLILFYYIIAFSEYYEEIQLKLIKLIQKNSENLEDDCIYKIEKFKSNCKHKYPTVIDECDKIIESLKKQKSKKQKNEGIYETKEKKLKESAVDGDNEKSYEIVTFKTPSSTEKINLPTIDFKGNSVINNFIISPISTNNNIVAPTNLLVASSYIETDINVQKYIDSDGYNGEETDENGCEILRNTLLNYQTGKKEFFENKEISFNVLMSDDKNNDHRTIKFISQGKFVLSCSTVQIKDGFYKIFVVPVKNENNEPSVKYLVYNQENKLIQDKEEIPFKMELELVDCKGIVYPYCNYVGFGESLLDAKYQNNFVVKQEEYNESDKNYIESNYIDAFKDVSDISNKEARNKIRKTLSNINTKSKKRLLSTPNNNMRAINA